MKQYVKPIIEVNANASETVYLANSGEKQTCRFGRSTANPGSDTCQFCSYSGGTTTTGPSGIGRQNYNGCVDNMPEDE